MSDRNVIGWDIGGVNTKVARVQHGTVIAAYSHPYEIQRDPTALSHLLKSFAEKIGGTDDDRHAITMTAELSQMFRTKRAGVSFVLDAVESAFPNAKIAVYTVDGRFLSSADARHEPLAVAASNWAATANVVALDHADAILVDIGTTSTDIIPITNRTVSTLGTTDPARLASGELVYTGALRTPVEAIAHHVPLGDDEAGVSSESFALVGDVHVWRGDLDPSDYSVTAPDGRPPSREFAGERLARIVCADREMLDDAAISRIADAVAAAQIDRIAQAILQVHARHPSIDIAIVTGLGAFIAERAALKAGLRVVHLAATLGDAVARSAPAAAVALLLDGFGVAHSTPSLAGQRTPNARPVVDVVVKIGGSRLGNTHLLDAAIAAITEIARHSRVVVVPGGGPFADTIRHADQKIGVSDDASHWMAILGMDQYAHLLADRCHDLVLTSTVAEIERALASGKPAVLAPYRWLRNADPLPHSWDVTSDSIAAWIAAQLRAPQLVLIKPPGADVDNAVDAYFSRVISPGTTVSFRA
jgi:probable H4MPT-linked C1 transfer pathway protein